MIQLNEIQKYCNGKNILLIGNGPINELPKTDIIVRINYGMMGGDTDIWINNLSQSEQKVTSLSTNQKYILRLNAERDGERLNRAFPENLKKQTYFWNSNEFNLMTKELDYERPLAGTISIYWLLNYTQPKSLTITGFNHFETKNVYAKTGLVKPHEIEKDKKYINSMVQQGKIKWI